MRYGNLILVVILAALMNGCGGGAIGPIDFSGFSVHWPFAVPGGPYDGLAGQPVQFDGSSSSDAEGHALTYEWNFGDGGTATLAMPTHTYAAAGTYTVTLRVCDASKCNINAGSTTAVIASVTNASPGGIWLGADSDGNQIVALITETGRFHFLDEFEFQGSGILTVSANDEITAGFRMLSPLGGSFADGSRYADCSLDGLVAERATIDGTVACTTSAVGTQTSVAVSLDYQALYDLDSDLAMFVGTWTDSSNPGSDVINVDAMGVITGQDGSGSGCIYSGQVSIIDPNFNAYDMELTYSSCTGESAALNGATFSGIGAIDNTVTPTQFILAATGIVQFNEVSLVLFYEQT